MPRSGHCFGLFVLLIALLLPGCRTTPSGKAVGTHPADSTPFAGHWYKVFEERTSWHEARRRCQEMGGYMACVERAEEQEFIASLAAGRYLRLGGTDESSEDKWVWVNGAPFVYSCWMTGQPNNFEGNENYLATYEGGEWVDVADEGSGYWMPTGFICEWDH